MPLIRIAVAAFAVVASAWFALGAIEAREINHITGLVTQSTRLSRQQSRAALDQLSSAGTLNPDRHVDVLRATVLARSGQIRGAVTLLQHVVQAEPKNLEAWFELATVAGADLQVSSGALRHIGQLVPRVSTNP